MELNPEMEECKNRQLKILTYLDIIKKEIERISVKLNHKFGDLAPVGVKEKGKKN